MIGLNNILKLDLKDSLKDYLKALVVALLSALLITFITGREMYWGNLAILVTLFSILITIVFLPISVGNSISKIYPLTVKLGAKRRDIALAFITKDIVVTLLGMIFVLALHQFFANPVYSLAGANESFIELYRIVGFDTNSRIVFFIFSSIAYSVFAASFSLEDKELSFASSLWGTALFLGMFVFTVNKEISPLLYVFSIAAYILGTGLRTYEINKKDL